MLALTPSLRWAPALTLLLVVGCPKGSQRDRAGVATPDSGSERSLPEDRDSQPEAGRRAPDPLATDLRVQLEVSLRDLYRPPLAGRGGRLEVTYQGEPLDLPPAWVADVQTGSGHGRTLTFLRLKGAGDHVEVEEVTWRGRSLGGDTATGRVRRVIVEEERLATFLELLRHLPTVRLKEVTQPIHAQGHRVGGGWMSSGDFFSLVRVVGPQGETLLERSFAGYPSSRDQLEYLPLEVVCAAGQRAISQAHRWVELLGSDLRRSHFVSAFVANREAMLEDSYWWVMEESVEALGYFGHPGAIPTVVSLRTRPQLQPRQLRKIERLLDEPDRWLTGAPKQLVE